MSSDILLKDIARALDISIGTVDRALHDRPDINPETRRRVLKAAKDMGYRPNMVASILRTKRKYRIALNLPQEIASFWNEVRAGIHHELSIAQGSVDLLDFPFSRLGRGEVKSLTAAHRAKVHGIITIAGVSTQAHDLLRQQMAQGLPVVFVGSSMGDLEGVAAISVNPQASGALAAELIGRLSAPTGYVSVVTGDARVPDHAEKLAAFKKTLETYFPGLIVLPAVEAHDDPREAFTKFSKLLASVNELNGCYVTTANSIPILQAIERAKCSPLVITTDLFPELFPYLRSDQVAATLYQRPRTQGRVAFRTLFDFLVKGVQPSGHLQLIPQLVLRSNLDCFPAGDL